MSWLRLVVRLSLVGILLLSAIILTVLWALSGGSGRPSWVKRPFLAALCWAMGLKITTSGELGDEKRLLVANHVTWLDILVLGALDRSYTLGMAEIRRWPVIGWLAYVNGTLFIQRGKGLSGALEEVKKAFSDGFSVTFFPEGTTTNGKYIRRFFPHLFQAAIESEVPIQPVMLTYFNENAQGHREVNEIVPYIHGTTLFSIGIEVMKAPVTHVHMQCLPMVVPSKDDSAKAIGRAVNADLVSALSTFYDHRYDDYEPPKSRITRD